MSDAGAFEAVVGFLGALTAGITFAGEIIKRRNARELRDAMHRIPPSDPPPTDPFPPPPKMDEVSMLRVRIAVLEAELGDARSIAADYARTAATLAREREERALLLDQLERERARADAEEGRAHTLRDEIARIHAEIEGGHTRLPTRESQHDARDQGKPTPRRGFPAL